MLDYFSKNQLKCPCVPHVIAGISEKQDDGVHTNGTLKISLSWGFSGSFTAFTAFAYFKYFQQSHYVLLLSEDGKWNTITYAACKAHTSMSCLCGLLTFTKKTSINIYFTVLSYTFRRITTSFEEGLILGWDSSALCLVLSVPSLQGSWLKAVPVPPAPMSKRPCWHFEDLPGHGAIKCTGTLLAHRTWWICFITLGSNCWST